MSIGICTMGSFSYQSSQVGGSDGYSLFFENKRKPIVRVDKVIQDKKKQNISVKITGVYYD